MSVRLHKACVLYCGSQNQAGKEGQANKRFCIEKRHSNGKRCLSETNQNISK